MTAQDPAAASASGAFTEFAAQVQRDTGLATQEEAEQLVRVTLNMLGEQITQGQAEKLRSGLPVELASELLDQESKQAESISKRTFLDQVSVAVLDSDLESVEKHVHVVLRSLAGLAPPGEIDNLSSQLPDDLAALFR